eukprot:UN12684
MLPESMIDAEWIVVTGTGIQTEFWGFNEGESFVECFNKIVEKVAEASRTGQNYPRVISNPKSLEEN